MHYKFKIIDLLHFLPTLLFAVYLAPGYLMTADQKLTIMLERAEVGRAFSDILHGSILLLSLYPTGNR